MTKTKTQTELDALRAEVAHLREDLAALRLQVHGHFDQHHAAVRPSVSDAGRR